jgi:hypothetical protein
MGKIRICKLRPGDEFEMYGLNYRVSEIKEGRVWFRAMHHRYMDGPMYNYGNLSSLGAKSKQFVNFISHVATSKNKKDVRRVFPPDPEIIGPRQDQK